MAELNMTTTANPAGHSQLGMPTAEDPMELVSDMDRRPAVDEDNEIDLDLTGEQPEVDDDDYMIDDANSDIDQQLYRENVPQAGNDDEMLDEEDAPQEDEDTMPINDEDLDDAILSIQEYNAQPVGDSYYAETLQQDPSSLGQDALREEPAGGTLMYDKDILSMLEGPSKQNTPRTETLTQSNTSEVGSGPDAVVQAETDTIGERKDISDRLSTESKAQDSSGDMPFLGVAEPHTRASQPDEEPVIHASVDSVGAPQDGGSPQLDVPLPVTLPVHPVVVVYQNNEISLFPPLEQNQESSQTFFVHDEKLAGQSISKLLEACRVVLDESIGEEDELEIRIEELGLYINEGAIESHTTTLTQILDTYLQLQHQDGVENPDPLYLTLCTRIKFSHRLASLVTAAAEGKGLSQLRFWESPEDSDELSDVQQGHNLIGATEVFSEDFTSAEVGAGSVAGSPVEQLGKNDNKSCPGTSLDNGVSSSARHAVVVESAPARALEVVEFPHDQGATALATTTGEPNTHNDNATNSINQGQQQTVSGPTSDEDRQTLQGPESPLLPAELAAENGDTIEYEDEDNVDQEASVGSSTLQGDVSEAAAEEAQLHHPELIYTAESNHHSAAEYPEEKVEVPHSLDEHTSIVDDVYPRDHSIAYGSEVDDGDDDGFDTHDGAPVELTEPEHEEHGEQESDHQQEFQEAEEDEEQLNFDQSLQYADHGLLNITDEDELTDHQNSTLSLSNVDQRHGGAHTDQFSTADSDEVAGQGSLYHEQHFPEGASGAYTAEQVTEEDASEDKFIQTHLTGVVNPATPTIQSGDGTHNLPAPATDVDEITYEEDEIEGAIEKDLLQTHVNASPKSSVSATLKRVRSPPEEDNTFETDFLVDPKRVRSE